MAVIGTNDTEAQNRRTDYVEARKNFKLPNHKLPSIDDLWKSHNEFVIEKELVSGSTVSHSWKESVRRTHTQEG
ncbi:36368_t:CDS:2, partial [Gigaspora margarita]